MMDTAAPERSRRRLPAGLLGMIAIIIAIEGYVVHREPDLMRHEVLDWRTTSRQSTRNAPKAKMLILGDSMVKFGVQPHVLRVETGRKAFNLAVCGGTPPASYFLLRRTLNAGGKPDAILVDFTKVHVGEGPRSVLKHYPWFELLSLREAVELSWSMRDADFLASTMSKELIPSVRNRLPLRSNIMTALAGGSHSEREVSNFVGFNRAVNNNAQVNPKNPNFHDAAVPPGLGLVPDKWSPDPVNAVYVRKFLDLAASRRIPVFCILPPQSPGTQGVLDATGGERRLVTWLRSLESSYPNLSMIDVRHAGYDATVFVDEIHLDGEGAQVLSTDLGRYVKARLSSPAPTVARWVDAPRFSGRPTELILQDINGSRVAVKGPKGGRRS